MARCEKLGAFALTEPQHGSDSVALATTARRDGDHWVLNGSKIFITNAGYASVFIIIAVTGTVLDKKGRKLKEISALTYSSPYLTSVTPYPLRPRA